MALKDWMNRPLKVQEDTFDVESAEQDVTDPVWPSAPLEPDVQNVRTHNDADPDTGEVRTLSGALDFLTNVVEDVFDIPDNDKTTPKVDGRHRGPTVDVNQRAATSWRGGTFDIQAVGGTKIVSERDDRTRVVVTNHGPGVAYLSAQKGGVISGPNMLRLADPTVSPALSVREFRTADEIWAYPAVAGTSQLVDVQDEYGAPE